ncbi:hypothetical protein FACS1894187_15810 [Synergistales bacterium]|nr:hypothetical protein FACS1894187_15810 [Synergistales bacterium]
MNKKVLFILLTLALTIVPAFTRVSHAVSNATTIDVNDTTTMTSGTNWAYAVTGPEDGMFTVSGDVTITGTTTANRVRVVVTSGTTANITLNGVNIDVSAINYTAFDMTDATVNLTLQGTSTLKSGMNRAGINVPTGAALTISGSGTVNATGGGYYGGGAGIGGGGAVTINGGTVNATGGGRGAGIGGSGGTINNGGNGGAVTINGGTVNATGGNNGAGIGGGGGDVENGGNGGNVTITGGMVNATGGGNGGASIGGGGSSMNSGGGGGTLTITGGSVRRTGDTSLEAPATNGALSNVYMTTLTMGSPAVLNSAVTAVSIDGVACLDIPNAANGVYGIKDMATDGDGKLYFWLPEDANGAKSVVITIGGVTYVGSVTPNATGTEAVTLTDATAPILSGGSVTRTSDTEATIGFTTDEAGTAYYLVAASGATAPDKAAVKAETSLGAVSMGAVSGKDVALTAGAKDIYVVVQDAAGNISQPLKIEAAAYVPAPAAPAITTTALASGTVGVAYSQTLAATGDMPITWSLNGGSLPSGLTLSSTGVISGNPTAAGAFAFTVKASNGVNPDATKNFSITIAAAPPTLDPLNNVTIGSVWTNLADNASGTGWTWDALTKTLTLTGDLTSGIKIASETTEITVRVANNVNVPKIVKTGSGSLRITVETGKTLTVEDTNGPAISSEGDIDIDSGTVKANVTGTGNTEPAIKAGGDITITGTADVIASNSGTGANSGGTVSGGKTTISTTGGVNITSTGTADAINATGGVEITNGVNTIEASGTGNAINANDGNGTISITGGHTEITDQNSGTNPYPPEMSGADTVVIVNGQIIFGGPATPDDPDNDDESGGRGRGRGGCDAGTGAGTLALLAAMLWKRRRTK